NPRTTTRRCSIACEVRRSRASAGQVIQKSSAVAARLLLGLDRLFALTFGLNGMARQYGERTDDHAERTGSEPQDVGHRAQAGATMVPEVRGYHRDPPFRRFTPAI